MTLKKSNLAIIAVVTMTLLFGLLLSGFHSQQNYAHAYTKGEKHNFKIEMKVCIAQNSTSQTKAVQERLKYIGLYSDKVDGSYGPNTKKAVKLFQQRNYMTADGSAGPDTTNRLRNGRAGVVGGKVSKGKYHHFEAYATFYIYAGYAYQ